MSFAEKYQKTTPKYTFKAGEDFEFYTCKALYELSGGITHAIRGIFLNKKSRYGVNPIVVSDDCFISLPKHLLESCEEMMKDPGTTYLINEGKCGLEIEPYQKEGNTYYTVKWVDID